MARTKSTARKAPAPLRRPQPVAAGRKSARLAAKPQSAVAAPSPQSTPVKAAKRRGPAITRRALPALPPSTPAAAAAAAAREAALTTQLASLQSSLDAQRRLHENTIALAVQDALKKLEAEFHAATGATAPASPRSSSPATSRANTPSLSLAAPPSPASSASSASASSPLSSFAPESQSLSLSPPRPLSLPPLPLPLLLPPEWPSEQPHHVTLQSLPAEHPDRVMVAGLLASSGLPGATVLQVSRVCNRPLWARYCGYRAAVMAKPGNSALATAATMGNEARLWHGTRGNAPHLMYATADGFDVRCAGHGMLGAGLYFSRSAAYSGQSYAHPVSRQNAQAGVAQRFYGGAAHQPPAVPPLFSVTADGRLKQRALPANCFQMFLARVVLGTEFDARQHGSAGVQQGRPPLRPFHCPSSACAKSLDLQQINLDALRDALAHSHKASGASSDGDGAVVEEVTAEEDEEAEQTSVAAPVARPVSRRGTARKRHPVVKSRGRGRAATAAVAATPAASSAPTTAPAATSPPAAASSPPLTLSMPPVSAALAAPAAALTAASSTASAPTAVPAAAAAMDLSCAESLDGSGEEEERKESDVEDSAAAGVAAAVVSPSPSPSCSSSSASADSCPLLCPHCGCSLGRRSALLSEPYRFDSVRSDHMSVVYESAAAYPEFLVTYKL